MSTHTLEVRFWAKVDKTHPDGCWPWTGSAERYGKIKINRRLRYAHVVAYELTHGPIPDGRQLGNLCGLTTCTNPDHWTPSTRTEIERRKHTPSHEPLVGHG